MPRNGQGVYSLPPNTAAVSGLTIESAPYNTLNNDIANDLNFPRPITAGGTGATNAADALANLGGVGQSNFLEALRIGDFWSTALTMDARFLKRNGTLYEEADYPELADLLGNVPDGVDWTSYPSGATQTLNAVAYGGGKYVAVGDGGVIYVSTDRKIWSPRSSGTSQNLNSVTYGAGIFVAVGESNTRVVSNNGDSWSVGTIATNFTPKSIVFGNSLFIASGFIGASDSGIYSSPDSTTWTQRLNSVAGGGIYAMSWSGARFVGGGQGSGSPNLYTSTNGTAWTQTSSGAPATTFTSSSNDGTTFVITGLDGRIYTTTNGTSVNLRATTGVQLNGSTYSADGKWLAVGNGGAAFISPTSTTWTSSGTGTALNLRAASFDQTDTEYFLVVGGSGITLEGLKTSSTQFRVPNDSPTYGWIKALDELP